MAQGEAEVAMQQPVRADDERQRQDDMQRRRQTGGGPLGSWDYEMLLADALLLSSADEMCTKLYNCTRHGKVDAC